MKKKVGAVKKKTQSVEAEAVFKGIVTLAVPLHAYFESLRDVVGRAQNGPPDGEGDGSISEARWSQLRDVVDQLAEFFLTLDELKGG